MIGTERVKSLKIFQKRAQKMKRKGPKKPIPQDMLDYLAKASGAKSILQKQGSESCLHILDLKDIQSHQKESYKANFLQGAREADPELAKHIIVQND